jgi:hypothetical protein
MNEFMSENRGLETLKALVDDASVERELSVSDDKKRQDGGAVWTWPLW